MVLGSAEGQENTFLLDFYLSIMYEDNEAVYFVLKAKAALTL